jgi:hypothetical protein
MTMERVYLLFLLMLFHFSAAFSQAGPVISSDFAGGNIRVTGTAGDTVWLKPDLSGTEGEWFYWYFKVSGMAGKTMRFQFTLDNQFSSYGPAYSINNRHNWKWLGENRVKDNGFSYPFAPEDTVAWFCTAIPYTGEDLEAFLSRKPGHRKALHPAFPGRTRDKSADHRQASCLRDDGKFRPGRDHGKHTQ